MAGLARVVAVAAGSGWPWLFAGSRARAVSACVGSCVRVRVCGRVRCQRGRPWVKAITYLLLHRCCCTVAIWLWSRRFVAVKLSWRSQLVHEEQIKCPRIGAYEKQL